MSRVSDSTLGIEESRDYDDKEMREERREKREERREKRSQKRPPEIPKLTDSRVCWSRKGSKQLGATSMA